MHVYVQIVLIRNAGHAETRRHPKLEETIFSSFSLLVQINVNGDLYHSNACCQINCHLSWRLDL